MPYPLQWSSTSGVTDLPRQSLVSFVGDAAVLNFTQYSGATDVSGWTFKFLISKYSSSSPVVSLDDTAFSLKTSGGAFTCTVPTASTQSRENRAYYFEVRRINGGTETLLSRGYWTFADSPNYLPVVSTDPGILSLDVGGTEADLSTAGPGFVRQASAGAAFSLISYADALTAAAGVPTSRTLTIDGTAYDLSADRSWTTSGGGSGTVTTVSIVTANGVSGSVANATTTPAITLALGAITPTSVAASGTVTGSNLSGTNTGNQTITLTGHVTGSGTGSFATTIAAGVVTSSMLAAMTSAQFAGIISDETGSGALVFATSATLVTPLLGTPASGVLTNCTGLTVAGGGTGVATLTTAYGLLAAGTTSTGNVQTLAAGTTSQILVGGGASALPVWTTASGSGAPLRQGSPTLSTPLLGTPTSGTLTNCTGLPITTGVSGLGTGAATFLATPSSANLAAAITDETGSGALVFANSPAFITPDIGSATGSVSGNAGTATALQNARNLNGVPFDGTNNITVPWPLTWTAVKTSNYSAAAGDAIPCDSTSGGFTVTLPIAPADKTLVAIKHVIQGGANVITYACGGSDTLNKAGGATSGTLQILAQSAILEYKASTAVWYIATGDTPLGQLDLRYATISVQTGGGIGFALDGGGSAITTGLKGYVNVPFGGTITKATLTGDATGSLVIDIWRLAFSVSALPTVANTIVASAPPTISSAKGSQDSTLTGWTKTFAAGDTFGFNVNSCSTITKANLLLTVTKT